jgi:hypothetical protein
MPLRELNAALDALEGALTALIQRAPDGSPQQVRDAAGDALAVAFCAAAAARTDHVALACAMERCLELLADGRVDAGVALPALAMAAHTARSWDAAAVKAARYEVETLLPLPGTPAPRRALDVPAVSLVRHPSAPQLPAQDGRDAGFDVFAAGWPATVTELVSEARRRLRIT